MSEKFEPFEPFIRIKKEQAAIPCFEALDDCYQQGWVARGLGYTREQNPYPAGTDRREWWDGGWCDLIDYLFENPLYGP